MAVAVLVGVAALIVYLFAQSMSGGDDDDPITAGDAADRLGERLRLSTNILYEVEGTATYGDITYETPTGTSQASPDIPLTISSGPRAGERGLLLGPFRSGDFVYISVQNATERGTVSCRISTEDGRVISENSASGAFAIATCDGSVP